MTRSSVEACPVGAALCLLSAACFGAMAIFGKLAYEADVSPGALLLLRFTLAAALLGLLLVVRPDLHRARPAETASPRSTKLTRRLLLIALGLGAIGYATQASLYFAALERVDASLVALVLYTYPALVTVAAVAMGRERLTPTRLAAVIVASAGVLLVLLGAGAVSLDVAGVALAFGASVTYTVYILVADSAVHRIPPVVLAALVMTGAAVSLAIRALVTGGADLTISLAGWLWVACIAVVSTVIAMLTFFAGLRRVGPSTASILSTFEPVVTTALAAVTLGEFLRPWQLVGGALVLCSAGLVQLRPRSRPTLLTAHVEALGGRPPAPVADSSAAQ